MTAAARFRKSGRKHPKQPNFPPLASWEGAQKRPEKARNLGKCLNTARKGQKSPEIAKYGQKARIFFLRPDRLKKGQNPKIWPQNRPPGNSANLHEAKPFILFLNSSSRLPVRVSGRQPAPWPLQEPPFEGQELHKGRPGRREARLGSGNTIVTHMYYYLAVIL